MQTTFASIQRTSIPPERKDHLSRSQLYFLVALLSVLILALSAYITWITLFPADKNNDQYSEELHNDDFANTSSEDTSSGNSTSDGSSEDITDWLTYTSTELGISFRYPSVYNVFESDQGTVLISLTLTDQIDSSLTQTHELVIFGSEDLMSLAVPNREGTLDLLPLELCGETRQFTPLVNGEGGCWGRNFDVYYKVRITDAVYAYLISYSEQLTTCCESEMTGQGECPGFVPEVTSKYETPSEDFDTGREILNTIELTEPC